MEQIKEYFAFISYSHEDEKLAKWLADELENYHLPTTLNGRDLPKDLRPIFRDVDELSAGNLPDQIYHALSVSKNLIVVCSPNSADSDWVNQEIEDYIQIRGGKVEHIFPFIIDGIPFSKNPKQECFPKAIRNLPEKEELLGGNINEQGGRNAAVVKIVAGMLEVSFDSLWQKYEREKRKKRFIWATVAIFMIALSFGVATWMARLNIQLEQQNRQLTVENIKVSSREVMSLLDKGELITALDKLKILMNYWSDDYRMDAPILEQTLRATYRYLNPDGIIKFYTAPLMDTQEVMDVDSEFVYVKDYDSKTAFILRFKLQTGEVVDTLFPACLWQRDMGTNMIFDVSHGLVLYEPNQDKVGKKGKSLRLYDSHTKRDYAFKGNYEGGKILSDEYMVAYIDGSDKSLGLFHINERTTTHIADIDIPFYRSKFTVLGDTLVCTDGERVYAWSISQKKKLYDIDYTDRFVDNQYVYENVSRIYNSNGQIPFILSKQGLMLLSMKQDSIMLIDSEVKEGEIAINEDGNMIAVKKIESDSLIIYIGNSQIFHTNIGDYVDDMFFIGSNGLVVTSDGSYSYYVISADFNSHELWASDGYTYLMTDEDNDCIYIKNDTIDKPYCTLYIKNPFDIKGIGFSPQGNYLWLRTDSLDYALADFKNLKKGFEIKTSEVPTKGDFSALSDYQISANDKSLMMHIYNSTDSVKSDEIRIYDLNSGTYHSYPLYSRGPLCKLNTDGSLVAVDASIEKKTYIRDTANWDNPILSLPYINQCSVTDLAFTPDSKHILISYSDGSLRLWNVSDGTLAAPVAKFIDDELWNIDISSDSQYGVGTLRKDYRRFEFYVWHIPTGQLVDHLTTDWSWFIHRYLYNHGLFFEAHFAKSGPPAIIINEHKRVGLSRVYEFLPYNELMDYFKLFFLDYD